MNDLEVFDTGVKSVTEYGNNDLVAHFIYCGYHYYASQKRYDRLKEIFLTNMRQYGIQSGILTMLYTSRWYLITKEKVKKAYEGKLINDEDWDNQEQSIHDDLETFFENLQSQKEIKTETVVSFFLPKLTENELKLVDEKNELHLGTYSMHYFGRNPDVDAEEMKKSNSKSKFVHGFCWRTTMYLALESNKELEKNENIPNKKRKM